MKRKYKPSDPYLNIKPDKNRQYSNKINKWTTEVNRYDMDTGEVLTKHMAETNYIKIKTEKHGSITNAAKTRGRIEINIGYIRNPQGNIFKTDV